MRNLFGLVVTRCIDAVRLSEFKEVAIYTFGPVGIDGCDFEASTSYGWYRQMEGRNALSSWLRAALARTLPKRVVVLAQRIPSFLAALVCVVRDHDLVDEGYGTPDTGCIDVNCRRCGRGFGRVVLY